MLLTLPTKYDPPDPTNPAPVQYGIVVAVTPTDPTQTVELHRQGDSGGAPDGNDVLVDSRLFKKSGDMFVDPFPNDNTKRWYRARHVLNPGETAGAYSGWVGAKPDKLPDTFPQLNAIVVNDRAVPMTDGNTSLAAQDSTGQTSAGHIYVPAANTVKVGTAASPSSLSKTIRVAAGMFVPNDDTTKWDFQSTAAIMGVAPYGGWISNHNTGTYDYYGCPLVFPQGVTLTGGVARIWGAHTSVNQIVTVNLWRLESDVATNVGTMSATNPNGWQNNSVVISELVTSARHYVATLELKGNVGNAEVRFQYLDITYTMPSYDKGY